MGLFSSKPKEFDLASQGPVNIIDANRWKYRGGISATYARGDFDDEVAINTAYVAKMVQKINGNLEYLISEFNQMKEENQKLQNEIDFLKAQIR